ncbi:MAG: fatty acid desaturase [Pseudomonadota bacterium]
MTPKKPLITNAASSGIRLDRDQVKQLTQRRDLPGLVYLAQWVAALALTSTAVWYSMGSHWIWLAMFVHGILLSVPAYALSHETAHLSVFRTDRLNKIVLWITSLFYMEEPLHRRYTHANHHAYTWHTGKDLQMPFDTPMTFRGWLYEISGLSMLIFHTKVLWALSTKRYTPTILSAMSGKRLAESTRNARIMVLIYLAIPVAAYYGITWPIWFVVIPHFLGTPVMLLFTLIQHVELQENSPSLVDSTRSFRTNWLGRFLYANMNYHCEHHLYPLVPFYSLPALNELVRDQLPEPDPGFFRTNLEVLDVVIRRSLHRNTKARSIRQASVHITEGRFKPIGRATM